jgi:amino acid permease
MNSLLIILIVIIILALIYLFYRNKEYHKLLESFDNNRNSLSTYMQSTVDYDSFMNTRNSYKKNLITVNLK